ncbi:MAG TPA: metallophosphoesterase [Fimbriimonadaceae bacterium]|nr:metallophosphoesterase [Fimbriimonadaceae bacterium]
MLRILHTNDFHGTLSDSITDRIADLKDESTLFFDTGDCIRSGNLAIPLRPEPAWPLLFRAGCDASVPGNRESHVLRGAMEAKFAGCKHPVLCANWFDKRGRLIFDPWKTFEFSGIKVGVFGVMVPIVTAKMATAPASQFLWEQPLPIACQIAEELRPRVDVVIALTHIGVAKDRELAQRQPGIDVILGGHSHTILDKPELVAKTWIAQGGSHGKFLGNYQWDDSILSGELLPLR